MLDKKLYLTSEMRRPHLIQRLKKPIGNPNPWAFGGGLENGGLSKEASNLLKGIFSFDYMGSSEFEWGAVPAALQFIAEQASITKRKYIFWKVNAGLVVANKHNGVFYICPKSYEDGVKTIIDGLLKNESTLYLKESCGLKDRIETPTKYNEKTVGWLELDNGFYFNAKETPHNARSVRG